MPFSVLQIERSSGKGRSRKTRIFSLRLLGHITAEALWDGPVSGNAKRPVWIAYLGTEQESQAFTANFRGGYTAAVGLTAFQIPKSSPHRWSTQKVPGGVVTVAYHPDLFQLDPVAPPAERVRFLLAPPRWWIEEQARQLAADFGDEAREAARAALFVAFLDRRTPLPLVHDLSFFLRLFRAARDTDWLHEAGEGSQALLSAEGMRTCGLEPPLAVSATQTELADLVVQQTQQFHSQEISHGTSRLPADRRLLPGTDTSAPQLRLALEVA